MRKKSLIIILCVLMGLMGIPITIGATYNYATVESVTGTVSVLKSGGEKAITPIKGTKLTHGDRIITGKGASLSIKIDDDKYIKVGEKTYLSLSELIESAETGSDTNIKLFSGQIFTNITKPLEKEDTFTIETPTAVMGAKGTKFVVKYTLKPSDEAYEGTNEVVVLEGTVALQDEQLKEEDKEILIHRNERSVFTADVLKELGDAIERALESGQDVSQINLQDLAVTNGILDPLEAKALDVFTLEIIKEDPQDIDPQYLEDIDQNIKDKKEEEAKEEEDVKTPRNDVEFDEKVEVVTPPKSSSGGSSTVDLKALKVTFLDMDNNGKADFMQVDFNKPVKDETLSPEKIVSFTGDIVSPVDKSVLASDVQGDVIDDATLYFAIDELTVTTDTDPTGEIKFDAGYIQDLNGKASVVSDTLTIKEKIAPKLQSAEIRFDGTACTRYLKLMFTEDISINGSSFSNVTDLYKEIAWSNQFGQSYADANAFTNSGLNGFIDGSYLKLRYFPYSLYTDLNQNETINFSFSENAVIYDISGNSLTLTDKAVAAAMTTDETPASITEITADVVNDTDNNKKIFKFSFKFDDYLSEDSIGVLTGNPAGYISTTSTYQPLITLENMLVQNAVCSNIKMSFEVPIAMGQISNGDKIYINLIDIYDLQENYVYYKLNGNSITTINFEFNDDTLTIVE